MKALGLCLALLACCALAAQEDYLLGPEDEVLISALGAPELSDRRYRIAESGCR